MQKCVKIVITGIDSIEKIYAALKKKKGIEEIEGVAAPLSNDGLEIVIHGPKAIVDDFVDELDEIVTKEIIKNKKDLDFMVEPFLKEEDYRGIFRFVKNSSSF